MRKSLIYGSAIALFALVADQATKAAVVANDIEIGSGYPIFNGFNLIHIRNDGVAFGAMGGAPWWSLVVLALGVCAWLAILLVRTDRTDEALAYGAIIGGALGNIIDRVRLRAVTDFLDFYIGEAHWPAFNFADVFVVSGAVIIILLSIIDERREQKT